ncbi:MAG: GxxExxY protein [Patescibacteria group bacterium]
MQIQLEQKIIFPELSYKIVGAAFDVFNELGWGLPEKDYQLALSKELQILQIKHVREVYLPVNYKGSNIGKYFADFLVDNKIILELKVVSRLGYTHARQLLTYLKSAGFKLGILLYFTKDGVKYRRVLNAEVK